MPYGHLQLLSTPSRLHWQRTAACRPSRRLQMSRATRSRLAILDWVLIATGGARTVCGLGCTILNLFTLPPRQEGTIRVRSVDLKATAIPASHTGGSLF